jgi:hypothetical protein
MTQDDWHDETLDRLVSHLASVEPGKGFHERTLCAVRARAAMTRSEPRRARWTLTAALAATALIALAISMRFNHFAPVTKPKGHSQVARVDKSDSRPKRVSSPTFKKCARRFPRFTPQSDRAEPDPTQLASFPAPPAPLTEQERLLVSVANSSNPVQLAILVPEKRAAEQAAEEEAYLAFFPPPPPLPPDSEIAPQP